MAPKSNLELMATYNQWMNKTIYEAASTLEIDELHADRGAFFGSIMGTLNHILVGDTIWLKRFSEHPSQSAVLDYVRKLPDPKALNTIVCTDLAELQSARIRMDRLIIEFTTGLTECQIASTLEYKNTKGVLFTKNFGHLIQHFFNHQTHHRGQVTTLFSQAGLDIGSTDLLHVIPSK